jgi:integrase
MAVKKVKTGWQVDFRPDGRGGKRIRKTFKTKREADAFEIAERAKAQTGTYTAPVKDNRRLSDLVDDWFKLYGHTLKDGEGRKTILLKTIERLGDPKALTFKGEDFLRYRNERLKMESYRGKKVSPNGVNHEHAYLSALYGTLIKLKNWKHENPMKGVPKLKIDEPELTFLELPQITTLLEELANARNKDAHIVAKICIATGARWGEAEKLTGSQIKAGKIHYVRTKSSKARAVPIDKDLEREIFKGRPRIGRLFSPSYDTFVAAIKRTNIVLPDGQMTHVLRHTYASHYMIADGNILKLSKSLGHHSLEMTLRYAHLAPGHLSEVIDKNPLAQLKRPQSVHTNESKPV